MSLQDAKRALKTVQNKINKKFGADTFVDTSVIRNHTVVSTGSAAIDDATGIGGIAVGRVYEIYGQFKGLAS
jgi:RecA/RadA recombinase